MKIKTIVIIIIILFLLNSRNAFALGGSIVKFDARHAYVSIKELSSIKYNGRLAGDNGNILAVEYVEESFKKSGLEPIFNNNSYLQDFDIYVPSIKGNYTLKVLDNRGNIIKEYTYGKDFKEVTFGNITPGIVEGKMTTHIGYSSNILLVGDGELEESTASYKEDELLKNSGIESLIYKTRASLRFRSPYKLQVNNKDGLIKLLATEKTFNELTSFSKKKYTLQIKSNACVKKVTAANVAGILEGTEKNLPPIILSCHLDHVGYDADGTIYPGALDNASGTGFLLECARTLETYSKKRSIIFIAFNAEEEGLLGSDYFVHHPPLNIKNAECLNFDMLGPSKDTELTLMSTSSYRDYAEKVSNTMKSVMQNITTEFGDSSDHASFNYAGIKSVTLINDDETKIHTPYDDIRNVDQYKFGEIFDCLNKYLACFGITPGKTSTSKEASKIGDENTSKNSNLKIICRNIIIIILLITAGLYLYNKRKP